MLGMFECLYHSPNFYNRLERDLSPMLFFREMLWTHCRQLMNSCQWFSTLHILISTNNSVIEPHSNQDKNKRAIIFVREGCMYLFTGILLQHFFTTLSLNPQFASCNSKIMNESWSSICDFWQQSSPKPFK